jgi:proline racemase
VTARVALAHAKGIRGPDQKWAYNSLVSNHFKTGAFVGTIAEEDVSVTGYSGDSWPAITVRVEGKAYYTGAMTFVQEPGDVTSEAGFTIDL